MKGGRAGPVLTTVRLRLTPYEPDDADALHALFVDPQFRRWLLDDHIVPRTFVEDEIASVQESFRAHGWGQWCVRCRKSGALLGITGFRHFHTPPRLELLYGLHPSAWGCGYASEAARRAVRYAFEELGFERVIASTDAPHDVSVRVMERIGMRFFDRSLIDGLDTLTYVVERPTGGSPGGATAR